MQSINERKPDFDATCSASVDTGGLARGSILFLINDLGTGGAESQVVELACRLRHRGWKVGVVTLIGLNHQRSRLEEHNIPWLCLGVRRGWPDPRAILRLASIL